MKLRAAVLSLAVLLSLPAAAQAATLQVGPKKACYRPGERVFLGGGGYTPNGSVRLTSDGTPLRFLTADPAGNFFTSLLATRRSGEKLVTIAATDQANQANTASAQVRLTALTASFRVRPGAPNRRLRLRARGFTTGKTLYAHVRKGRYRRNIKVGRLRGACRKISTRTRIFSSSRPPTGRYLVQFDTRRRFSRKTRVGLRTYVRVFRRVRFSAANAASSEPLRPLR